MNGKVVAQHTVPVDLLCFSYRYVMVFTISVQAIGLLTAFVLGIHLHYDKLIRTHCLVPNFWPSISKLTGDHLPERYVWRLAIALISFPRIMDGMLYYKFFATQRPLFHVKRWYRWLNKLNYCFLIIQLFLLFTFTFVSSRENMDIHLYAWLVFLFFSVAHMVSFIILFGCGGQKTLTQKEQLSLKVRIMLLGLHLIAIALFWYFGKAHIMSCQPYAFSYAAICECAIAGSNLAFHAMQLLDFHSLKLNYCCSDHLLKRS